MAKVYSFKTVVEMSINSVWMHLRDFHLNLSNDDLYERVMTGNLGSSKRSRANTASTFLCSEKNLTAFLRHSLTSNKEKIMDWIQNSNRQFLVIYFDLCNAPNQCIKGRVFDGNHYQNADGSMIILERIEGIFRIKTAYPNWKYR